MQNDQTDKVYVVHVSDYNEYAQERYTKAVNAWKVGESFPYYGHFGFSKTYGYVRYRVDANGTILVAKWARHKRELMP